MDYRMLVLDIDGTLTNSKKEITDKTKQAILEMQRRGHLVVLASGRPTCGITRLAKELELHEYNGFILSFNGGKIVSCKTGESVYEKVLPKDCVLSLHQFAKEHDVNIISYEGDCLFTECVEDKYVEIEARINGIQAKKVDNFTTHATFPLNKCLMLEDGDKMEAIEPIAKMQFGEYLNVYRSEPFFLEIMPQHIDKAYALGKLLDHVGLTKEQMVACGDGFNDISMIEYAGMGIAMENAQPAVKQVANEITTSNDEDGIARVVERFFS